MKSIYTELALYGRKISVLRLIMSFPPYLRSAMVRYPGLPRSARMQNVEKFQ